MPRQAHSKRIVFVAIGAAVLGLLAWQGQHISHWLPQIEQSVAALGPWAPVVYVVGTLALSPLLVPDSFFGVGAGVVFGLGPGFIYYFVAVYAACIVVYVASRRMLRDAVLASLEARPALSRMASAASHQGLRLTFWIRLVPINPMLVSYALGASGVPFRAYALGTLGMLPQMFLTVYLGVVAAHVTRMAGGGHAGWTVEGAGLLLGIGACAGAVVQVSSIAWRQIRAAEGGDAARGLVSSGGSGFPADPSR